MGVIRSYLFKRAFGNLGSGYVPEYQAVLDFAILNTITTPNETQNIKNDLIVRNLIFEGVWEKLDLFYYFEQPIGLEEFITLNWVDANTFRLYQSTPALEPDFIANSGIKNDASGKYYKTGYTPSTNATNVLQNSVGIFYKLFDVPTIYTTENKIFGVVDGTSNTELSHTNTADGFISLKHFQFQTSGGVTPLVQGDINQHYHFSKNAEETSFVQVFVEKTHNNSDNFYNGGLASEEFTLLAINNNSVIETSGTTGLKYFALGSEMRYQNEDVYDIMNGSYFNIKIDTPFLEVLDPTILTASNPAYFSIYKSSDFPSITTTKDYFVLWSTNHASPSSSGGVWWGETDDLDFTNFVENGEIVGGYQDETPDLILIPDGGDGRVLHLLYHSDGTDPVNGGLQQTHLLTSSGGVLHNAIWTDEGTILGVGDGAVHTGYAKGFIKGVNDYAIIHGITGWSGATHWVYGKSTSVDYRAWVRESSDVDVSSFMPYERFLQYNITSYFFERNGEQFYIAVSSAFSNSRFDTSKLTLNLCDGNYYPIKHIGTIKYLENNVETYLNSIYRVGDILHLFMGGNSVLNRTTFDLTKLDNLEKITAITDLTSFGDIGFEEITLTFTEPKTTIGNIGYNVYVDGVFNKRAYDFPILVDGLTNLQTYNFTVKSINVSGIESDVSNTFNQQINGTEGIPYSSIISRYTFEDNVNDVVGSNNGVNSGVTFVTGGVGKSGVFNNSTSTNVTIADSDNLTFLGAFSISLLYKSNGVSNQWLVSKRDASDFEHQFVIYQNNLRIYLNGGGTIDAYISFVPTIGQQYHLGVSYNNNGLNSGLEIYIDGIKQTLTRSGTFTGIVNTASSTYISGLNLGSPIYPMNSNVDEVIFWDDKLTDEAFLELATEQLLGNDITP